MRYWLFKSEPSTWSWDQQVAKGDAGEEWDGVRNYQARNFMREMAVGDLGFFYHSQSEKAVVGIVEVIAEAHPDSTTDDERWECVDIKAVEPMPNPSRSTRSRRGGAGRHGPREELPPCPCNPSPRRNGASSGQMGGLE
jgi:predicted RNA-binding protein with PUA-like domain